MAVYWGCIGGGYDGFMGWALCRTVGGWLLPTTGFEVKEMLEGGFAYWKLPLVVVVAGAAVYAKCCAVGAYWTLPGWAYVIPEDGGAVVAGCAKDAAWARYPGRS
jgi:hypothetical protein